VPKLLKLYQIVWYSFESLSCLRASSNFFIASSCRPKGVICLQSALSYYDLTTYIPWEVSVAIQIQSDPTWISSVRLY